MTFTNRVESLLTLTYYNPSNTAHYMFYYLPLPCISCTIFGFNAPNAHIALKIVEFSFMP